MEVFLWRKGWGLPTIDSSCLSVLTYCKFSGTPVKTTYTKNPYQTKSGQLPVFAQGGKKLTDVQEIFVHLRKQYKGSDYNLGAKQSADNAAFTALVEEKLAPALGHMWWVDEANYSNVTRSAYASGLYFPFGNIWPARMSAYVTNKLYHIRGGRFRSEKDIENQVYEDGKECLNTLSTLLGDKDFFFGKSPSSLDALVFGYLAPLLKAPLVNVTLQNHLNGCPNLCAFCKRIIEKYFPLTEEEEEEVRKAEEKRRQDNLEAMNFPNRRRNISIAVVLAITANILFLYQTRMLPSRSSLRQWFRKDGRNNVRLSPQQINMDGYDEQDDDDE